MRSAVSTHNSRFLLSSRSLPTSLRSIRTSVANDRLNSSRYCPRISLISEFIETTGCTYALYVVWDLFVGGGLDSLDGLFFTPIAVSTPGCKCKIRRHVHWIMMCTHLRPCRGWCLRMLRVEQRWHPTQHVRLEGCDAQDDRDDRVRHRDGRHDN